MGGSKVPARRPRIKSICIAAQGVDLRAGVAVIAVAAQMIRAQRIDRDENDRLGESRPEPHPDKLEGDGYHRPEEPRTRATLERGSDLAHGIESSRRPPGRLAAPERRVRV